MEGIPRIPSMSERIGERADDIEELGERPRPPVQQQQRGGVRLRGPDVQEMHALPVDLGDELRVPIDHRLLYAPVVVVAPVRRQIPEVLHRDALAPPGAG